MFSFTDDVQLEKEEDTEEKKDEENASKTELRTTTTLSHLISADVGFHESSSNLNNFNLFQTELFVVVFLINW